MNLSDLFEKNVTAELSVNELWDIMTILTRLNLIGDMLKKDGDNKLSRMGVELMDIYKSLADTFGKFDKISDGAKKDVD